MIACGLFLLFMAAQGVIGYAYLGKSQEVVTSVVDRDFASSIEIGALAVEGEKLRRFEKEFFIYVDDSAKRAKYVQEWTESFNKLTAQLAQLKSNPNYVDARDRTVLNAWTAAAKSYGEGFNGIVKEIDAGRLAGTREANAAIGPYKDKFRVLLDGAGSEQAKRINRSKDGIGDIKGQFDIVTITLAALTLAGLVLAILIVLFIPAMIARPIEKLTLSAQSMSRGNLGEPVVVEGAAEFKDLASTLDRMRLAQRELLKRIRSQTGGPSPAGQNA
jgi:methyl-accepting chemotaxis protein